MTKCWRTSFRHRANDEIIVAAYEVVSALFSSTESCFFNPDVDGLLSAATVKHVRPLSPLGIAACNGNAAISPRTTAVIESRGKSATKTFADYPVHLPPPRVFDRQVSVDRRLSQRFRHLGLDTRDAGGCCADLSGGYLDIRDAALR